MAAVLLALGAGFAWGFSDFTGGVLTRRRALLTTLTVSQLAGLTFVGVLAATHHDPLPPLEEIAIAVAAGLAGLLGIAGLYRGFAVGAMSVVAPLSATAAVVPAIVGAATGENLGVVRYTGAALAITGVVVASREPGAGGRLAAGALPALVAIAGFGAFFVGLGRASEHSFWWAALFARASSTAAVAGVVLAARPLFAVPPADAGLLALVGILDTGANVLFAAATTQGSVSVVSVLVSLYPLVVVILAHVLLGERIRVSQRLGAVAALAGAALVSTG
jgi:drug/metabolite transporter (DMT)-like permease